MDPPAHSAVLPGSHKSHDELVTFALSLRDKGKLDSAIDTFEHVLTLSQPPCERAKALRVRIASNILHVQRSIDVLWLVAGFMR